MSLFYPEKIYNRITDINPEVFVEYGIKALALDVDNTLSTHHGMEPLSGVTQWLRSVINMGIKVILVSNSTEERLNPFSQKLGIDCISLSLKPLPRGLIKARKALGVKKKEIIMIGDQIFTDILGANLYGIRSFLVMPAKQEDKFGFKFRRKREKRIIERYYKNHAVETEA